MLDRRNLIIHDLGHDVYEIEYTGGSETPSASGQIEADIEQLGIQGDYWSPPFSDRIVHSVDMTSVEVYNEDGNPVNDQEFLHYLEQLIISELS